MLNFTIFIFPPHFPSFNNFKMIKMPQNFLIKLNLWWDYSLVHAQRKKFAAIRGEKRLFVSHHHPLPQITGLFFLLDLVVLTSLLKLREPGTGQWDYMKGKLLNYEFKIAREQALIRLGEIARAAHQRRC